MFEKKDDTILAKWLAGALTEDELAEFEKDKVFLEYRAIAQGMDRFKKPEIDKDLLRRKLNTAIDREKNKKSRLVSLRPLYYISGIAATVMLIIGVFFNEVTYSAALGQQATVQLPDGTTVSLNADSKLTHKRFFWNSNKEVNLEGEGFFNVTKGQGFLVKTSLGTVSVLGTEFNIKIRNKRFDMACYTGKVQFEAEKSKERTILVPGDVIYIDDSVIKKEKTGTKSPSWVSGTSTFNNVPFVHVVEELERQYHITVKEKESLRSGNFTGNFVHDNIDVALKTIFAPMGQSYRLSSDKRTVTVNAR